VAVEGRPSGSNGGRFGGDSSLPGLRLSARGGRCRPAAGAGPTLACCPGELGRPGAGQGRGRRGRQSVGGAAAGGGSRPGGGRGLPGRPKEEEGKEKEREKENGEKGKEKRKIEKGK
jgi:hypothetical protein